MKNKKGSTKQKSKTEETKPKSESAGLSSFSKWGSCLITIATLLTAISIGHWYANYSKQLHENDMWFSQIQQVEREISFRTECGLYFSYYKQLVLAPSISQGMHDLMHDNITEHLRTINILERFNIYQEVVLGVVYRLLPTLVQKNWEYVYFYLDAINYLHGCMMVSLFVTAWLLSGNPFAGMLANALFIFNRSHMTRLFKSHSLREHFSIPFVFMQMLFITLYFKKNQRNEKFLLFLISICTFLYIVTWQFSQFVMLLQAFALFAVFVMDVVEPRKVKHIFYIFLGSLSLTCLLMFGNDMVYTSLASNFCIAALLVMLKPFCDYGIIKKLAFFVLRIFVVLVLTAVINIAVKKFTNVESDAHVYKFVLTKFGIQSDQIKDFDVRLYLCNGGFLFMPLSFLTNDLTSGFVFPIYAVCITIALLILIVSFLQKIRNIECMLYHHPELVFNIIVNVFFGVLALSTLRMKFLWFPHMCVMAASLLAHKFTWDAVLEKINPKQGFNVVLKHSFILLVLAALVQQKYEGMQKELEGLYQFDDPDTVELMNWINSSTSPNAAFSGSMQLLAGVKLCTNRPITNHPHYENKFLRIRTKEVYQIYARVSPADVHTILRRHGTDYIILENSICYAQKECKLTDILDFDNNHGPTHKTPRFCNEIKHNRAFEKYFRRVFVNRTFYVYKLVKNS